MAQALSIDPAPGESRWLALALVNTELEPRGRPIDLLADAAALRTWLTSRGLIDEASSVGASDLGRFHELRAAVRSIFAAAGDGIPPEPDALAALNAISAGAPAVRQLAWEAGRPVGRWRPAVEAGSIDLALSSIAANAIELLGEDGARLASCGAHGCVRMFVREHARRRWCSRACGDRVRVARHYEKNNPPARAG